MVLETVYLETTFISYLVSLPSRDLIVAAHQQMTAEWWTHRRGRYECYVSEIVYDEVSAGDEKEIKKRLAIIETLKFLDVTDDVKKLTEAILHSGVIPQTAVRDAAHIAMAAIHEVDYLLTWNCKHIANAHILKKIESVCHQSEFFMPTICTPEELMEDE